MTQILLTSAGMLLAFLLRDLVVIAVRIYSKHKTDRIIDRYREQSRKMQEKFNEWLDEFKPEEYGNEKNFSLQVCNSCDKLRKNVVDQNGKVTCLECAVNGIE